MHPPYVPDSMQAMERVLIFVQDVPKRKSETAEVSSGQLNQ
jgi:hypothetical protein